MPDSDDWYKAGVILNSYLRGLRTRAGGKTPRLQQGEKSRLVRDALIAVTARRVGATVVINNLADYEKIKRYCKIKVKSGKDFFGY